MKLDYEEDIKQRTSKAKTITLGSVGLFLLTLSTSSLFGILDWRLDALSHFRMHVLILTLVLLSLGFLFFSKILIFVSAFALVISLVLVLPFIVNNYNTREITNGISISAINVLFNNEKKEDLIMQIKNLNHDIVILSEVNNLWDEKIREHLGDYYKTIIRSEESGRDDILLLSKLDSVYYEPFQTKGNHSGLKVNLKSGDKIITIYGIHPYSPMDEKYWTLRNRFFSDLRNDLKNNPYPTIIAGDFNSSYWSPVLKKFINESDLKLSFGLEGTYPSKLDRFGIDIDHIAYSKEISMENKRYFHLPGSDHRGISSIFRVY